MCPERRDTDLVASTRKSEEEAKLSEGKCSVKIVLAINPYQRHEHPHAFQRFLSLCLPLRGHAVKWTLANAHSRSARTHGSHVFGGDVERETSDRSERDRESERNNSAKKIFIIRSERAKIRELSNGAEQPNERCESTSRRIKSNELPKRAVGV